MTTPLDDLLNSSSISIYPATVQADWEELEPGYNAAVSGANAAEALNHISQQIGPNGFTVQQSFDDGLPDAVSSTTGNDASGSISMDLVGRPGTVARADSLSWNAGASNGIGTNTTITTVFPIGLTFWDYTICVLTVQSADEVTEITMEPDSFQRWEKLGEIFDTPYRTWVFGRRHFIDGVVPPVFQIPVSANWTFVMGSINCAATPSNSVLVPVLPNKVATKAETVSGTGHTMPPVDLERRGWTVGAVGVAAAAGPITATGGATVVGQATGAITTALLTSPLRSEAGNGYAMTFNTSTAVSAVPMVHFGMEVRERAQLDGVGWFSPLNSESPVYGFERDTAPMSVQINYVSVTGDGLQGVEIFNGQMAGVGLQGRTAQVEGVSRTRLLLDNSQLLPTVYGDREYATTDWLATWIMGWGGQFPGIATTPYTRWWAPWHGSLHPHMDGSTTFAQVKSWEIDRTPYGPNKIKPIEEPDGPFVTAMWGCQTDTLVHENYLVADRNWTTDVPGQDNPVLADIVSQQNSVGRFSLWVRGDDWHANPTVMSGGEVTPFGMTLWNNSKGNPGTILNYIRMHINPNRNFTIYLGDGTVLTGGDLPTDGLWHFICFTWNYDTGEAFFKRDNVSWNLSGRSSASEILPVTTQALYDSGGYTALVIGARIPVAEMQLECGLPFNNDVSRFYPTPLAPSLNATFRPTHQELSVIANPVPVQGWATLQEVAESTLAHLRVNEADNVEMVPQSYFGETAQMTVETLNVLDTDFNASELSLIQDPTRTRNVVTTQYTDTRVGATRVPILDITTAMEIKRGSTLVTFALDTPTAETHGAAVWYGSTPDLQKLTALQIAGTNPIQNENVMSVNSLPDGTGVVYASTIVTGRIVDWDSSTVTIRFYNGGNKSLFLANSGSGIPFLRVLGYPIQTADGYTTVRDPGSISRRRERALSTALPWTQKREWAEQISSQLVTTLSRPRPQISVTVQGDPRRVPGKLCQLVDSTGVKASGNWRILAVQGRYTGPMFLQDLQLVSVGEIAVWDVSDWDEAVWGE